MRAKVQKNVCLQQSAKKVQKKGKNKTLRQNFIIPCNAGCRLVNIFIQFYISKRMNFNN